ncbi:MAG: hypothetical protein ACKVJR_02670, partial [Flavobacteriales bacterium]
MERNKLSITVLEKKIIELLNKLKSNHLNLLTFQEQNEVLKIQNSDLKKQLSLITEENKSLKITNN